MDAHEVGHNRAMGPWDTALLPRALAVPARARSADGTSYAVHPYPIPTDTTSPYGVRPSRTCDPGQSEPLLSVSGQTRAEDAAAQPVQHGLGTRAVDDAAPFHLNLWGGDLAVIVMASSSGSWRCRGCGRSRSNSRAHASLSYRRVRVWWM